MVDCHDTILGEHYARAGVYRMVDSTFARYLEPSTRGPFVKVHRRADMNASWAHSRFEG